MATQSRIWIWACRLLAIGCLLLKPTTLTNAQQSAQKQSSGTRSTHAPVSLAHCYWHFLLYQNHLDSLAEEQAAHGKDGRLLKGQLQTALDLSDEDFAPIRLSSVRLAVEINVLNGKAATIAASNSSTSAAQLQALTVEREADINAEVSYLRNALGPAKTAAFETFIVRLFAPKTVAVQVPVSPSKPAPTEAQQ